MKAKPTINNFIQSFHDRQNDTLAANTLPSKEPFPPIKLNKNITCTEDQKIMQNPQFLLLCIRELEAQLMRKQQQYSSSIANLHEKIQQKQIEGRSLNDQLTGLRKQMVGIKEEANELVYKILKKSDSPYELYQPKRKLKKNKSTQFLLFKSQTRSKSKKDKHR